MPTTTVETESAHARSLYCEVRALSVDIPSRLIGTSHERLDDAAPQGPGRERIRGRTGSGVDCGAEQLLMTLMRMTDFPHDRGCVPGADL
jgi:hypothetical protein